ncbi:MAG: ATP-binding protein, partial [Myxococcota bacterium]
TLSEAARRAESANDAKGRFLAQMSHEIRTPLHGILGAQELLSKSSLDADQQDLVRTTTDSGRALVDVIDAVLDLAKIESGGLQLEQVSANLHTLVRDACAGVRVLVAERGIEMRIVIEPGVPRWVMVDPTRLRQVLLNLLSNAVKFTSEGHILVQVGSRDDGVQLVVEDTGIGIPSHRVGQIFEPFVQADASTTRRFGGTGLGLALVRDLVDRMAGTILVSSTVGEGSRFEVTLPLQTTAPPSFEARDHGELSPLRLLLVEDNDVNRIVGRRVLQACGHEVHVAEDGNEALAMLDQVQPDAVLMDCDMPVMDGFEATRHIRDRDDSWAGVPIIALTASALESDRTRCLRAGMDGVVTKPLKLEALDAALRANVDPAALRGKR